MKYIFTFVSILSISILIGMPKAIGQIVIEDGDFKNWNYVFKGATGYDASMEVIAEGGNPGAYIKATTVGKKNAQKKRRMPLAL